MHDEARALRDALGMFATGVTIITTTDEQNGNRPVGMTANSFSSVSLDPPLVLWNLGDHADCGDVFSQTSHFAVHILRAEQQEISTQFAMKGGNKFDGVEWASGVCGSPVLGDFAACFECRTEAVYPGGDHKIIVGRVEKFSNNGCDDPLLFFRGQYRELS